jgi:hypothetical protein
MSVFLGKMDIIDNIIYASINHSTQSENISPSPVILSNAGTSVRMFSFEPDEKFDFCSNPNLSQIEQSIMWHWDDVNAKAVYKGYEGEFSNFEVLNYSLMYSYMLENTQLVDIFKSLIQKYSRTEDLGGNNSNVDNQIVFHWLKNADKLFFENELSDETAFRNLIRPNSEATRRNAYWRMFGIELAFSTDQPVEGYDEGKESNLQFIFLFESFLSEIWAAYLNAHNFNGPGSMDVTAINDLATRMRELLSSRRDDSFDDHTFYGTLNISQEEFSAVLLTAWFNFVVSYNSPVVEFLGCQADTSWERLTKMGNKVGIAVHSECRELFELSEPMNIILNSIEAGDTFTDRDWVQNMVAAPKSDSQPSIHSYFMNNVFTIINNWEKATGHKIKNPEAPRV